MMSLLRSCDPAGRAPRQRARVRCLRRSPGAGRGARARAARRAGPRAAPAWRRGIAPGVMLNSVSPRPTSSVSSAGSDAISPQSDTGMRCRAAARRTMTIIRRIAGCSGSYSRDTRSSARSTARQYWIRSLVPMVKKSTSRASRSAVYAAAGISIMTPIGTCGTVLARGARGRRPPPRPSRRASRSCSTPDTNGNMMRSCPWRAARSSARSWTRNSSGRVRLRRRPRRPWRLPRSSARQPAGRAADRCASCDAS